MDGTNHSRGSTIQSLSPDKREGLEHELRPEALASIAREENTEASTNTTHAAVSPKESTKTRAETASTGLVPPHESSTHTDRAVRTEASVDDKSSLAIDFDGDGRRRRANPTACSRVAPMARVVSAAPRRPSRRSRGPSC